MQRPSRAGMSGEEVRSPGACRATRRAALTPLALVGLLALAGCAGGGGGGPGSQLTSALSYTYPTSLATATAADPAGGAMASYALDPSTPQMDSIKPTVLSASASSGVVTLSISAISLPSGGPTEPAFVVSFNPTTASPLATTDPLAFSGGCSGCFETTTATAYVNGAPAGKVTFTYLNPSSPSFPLNYSTLGSWTEPTGASPWSSMGGWFSIGILTRGIDLPTSGSATYNGYFVGQYVTSDPTAPVGSGTYLVGANAQAQVDFGGNGGKGAVTFSTSNTHLSGGGLASPQLENSLNLSTSSSMTITRTVTSNSFSGTVSTANGLSGHIGGSFYGKPASTSPYAPPEMGGAAVASNSTNTQSVTGSFALTH